MRVKFVARSVIFVLLVLASAFILISHFRPADVATEQYVSVLPHRSARKRSQLLQQSVFLRYGDMDPLTIFSAYGHDDYITVVLSSYGYFMRRLVCRLFDEHMRELLPAFQSLVFPEFTVRCPASSIARFVALSLNSDDNVTMENIRDIIRPETGSKTFFSVCLAPLWGSAPKWLMLVEFIEYYILQGAQYFYVYKHDIDNLTQSILDSYMKVGKVDIVDIDDTTSCMRRHRCRHEMQLQPLFCDRSAAMVYVTGYQHSTVNGFDLDCIYRTRGRSTWVATVDLDERICITGDTIITDFIKSSAAVNHGELRFRCRWVLRTEETPMDPKTWRLSGSHLPMAEWHNTSHVAPVNHTTKSIIQPTKVESMGVHQVLRFAPGAHAYLVPPDKAVIRHYRITKGWTFFLKEAETFGSFEYTELASDSLQALNTNVIQMINQVFPK